MITGIVAGGSIWCMFYILLLIFPEPLSLAGALFIGPFAGGYFAARLSGIKAASVLTIAGTITTLALSVIYIPHTSWEYLHQLWAGITVLVVLLVLANFVFLGFGSMMGIQARSQGQPKEERLKIEDAQSAWDQISAGRGADIPSHGLSRMAALVTEERDLMNDLTVIKEKKALEGFSPELICEKKIALEKQLLDITLEKERLLRKTTGNQTIETIKASLAQ